MVWASAISATSRGVSVRSAVRGDRQCLVGELARQVKRRVTDDIVDAPDGDVLGEEIHRPKADDLHGLAIDQVGANARYAGGHHGVRYGSDAARGIPREPGELLGA